VAPIHLPGREDRADEPLSHSAEAIAAAVADRADRPYAIYGHSMGARLGFEAIRALRRQGARLPFRFYPAACLPPDAAWPFAGCVGLPDDDFLNVLAERLNAPVEAWTIPELRELVLPVLRADFAWTAEYQYQAEPPLDVPLAGLAGADDAEAGPSPMLGWSRHTSASFRLHTLPGDHFFLRSAAAEVTSLLSAGMLQALGEGTR
jgi:surfactin synthase thioesterase subunit